MKAILTEESTAVYDVAEDGAAQIATIHKDEEMELGKILRKKGGKVWVEVTLPNDVKGYILGGTKIFAVRDALIPRSRTELHAGPSKSSRVLKTLERNKTVTVTGIEKNDEGSWFKSTDEDGAFGYISTEVKLRVAPELSRRSAMRNLVIGVLFLVIGIGLTVMDSRPGQSNNLIYLAYIVIFLGLVQAAQGAFELAKLKKKEAKEKK